jgi:activator of HSP90 ATPase
MVIRNIRQTVVFKSSPHLVYETLMDTRRHARFTGGKAIISRKIGGKISTFDGYAEGVNLALAPDEKIVQSWRAADWPAGHFSKITFTLKPVAGGTRLTFSQTGVPGDQYEDIARGWRDYYWAPMKEMLEK